MSANTRRACLGACLLLFVVGGATAQQEPHAPPWAGWGFLLGDWVTEESGGVPGPASEALSSFKLDLQGQVLVRTSRVQYPASKDRPAFVHDDLMVVYREPGTERVHAIYFDNEGHVIHCTAGLSPDGKSATFLSDAAPAQPRFRLTYRQAGKGLLSVKFEIAPPQEPDQFQLYVEGTARRKKP
jgi:hypothetical protein